MPILMIGKYQNSPIFNIFEITSEAITDQKRFLFVKFLEDIIWMQTSIGFHLPHYKIPKLSLQQSSNCGDTLLNFPNF